MAHFTKTDGTAAAVCGYAEAAYFGGFHFQHIASRDEWQRLERKRADGRKAAERRYQAERRSARAGMTGRREGDKAAMGAPVRPVLRAV